MNEQTDIQTHGAWANLICYTKGKRREEMEDDSVRPPRLSHTWSPFQRVVHISRRVIC